MEGTQGPAAPNQSDSTPREPLPEGTLNPNGWKLVILSGLVFPLLVLWVFDTYKYFLARPAAIPAAAPTSQLPPATGKPLPKLVFSGNEGGSLDGVRLKGAEMTAETNIDVDFKNIEVIGSLQEGTAERPQEETAKPNGWKLLILTMLVCPLLVNLATETYKHFLPRRTR